ncbi:MAG: hypothetical protein A3A81_02915 [Omnitrophica bacterium RIFCSPLOWO2_01_FULL_45_10b]|nr:MAG: hypothetical protein A3A81_02915 [Omnitrophica bacterium RIFCSPLOWO2_01_FULL_45_10b]
MKKLLPKQVSDRNTKRPLCVLDALVLLILFPAMVFGADFTNIKTDVSGYVKSLNFVTRTSLLTPEFVDRPTAFAKENSNVFNSLERARFQIRTSVPMKNNKRAVLKIDYDHQPYFGTFVSTGDFRTAKKQSEDRQFLDLSQTLVEEDNIFYEHRLYRASLAYESDLFDLEIGRQQIPWGVGHFFTPTDLFNPFNPTQIELEERDGVDAVNFTLKNTKGFKTQLVYTPGGRKLHPQRYLGRISRDVKGYEIGILGGRVKRDHVIGTDLQGNVRGSAVRGEFLFREAELEKDFFKFTVNADYNLPHNIYVLMEYHFNGQGRRDPDDYQIDRFIRGEIQQLGKNFLALSLGYDLTSLIRFEYRTIYNLNDTSLFMRPEIQYELMSNVLLAAGSQLFVGANNDEFGRPKNLFFGEVKYSY